MIRHSHKNLIGSRLEDIPTNTNLWTLTSWCLDNGTTDLCDSSHTISNNRIMISLIGFLSLLTSADSPNDAKFHWLKITATMTGHSGEHTETHLLLQSVMVFEREDCRTSLWIELLALLPQLLSLFTDLWGKVELSKASQRFNVQYFFLTSRLNVSQH